MWPAVNYEYVWNAHKHTERESGVVGHQTLLGQWCKSLSGSLEIKTPLQVSYISFRDDHQLLQPWHDRTSLSDTILPSPSAAISSLLLDLILALLYSPHLEGGAPSLGYPFVSHPSIVTIFCFHHHTASFLLRGDWCVRTDRDALYLSSCVPGDDRCVMLCRMTDSNAWCEGAVGWWGEERRPARGTEEALWERRGWPEVILKQIFQWGWDLEIY